MASYNTVITNEGAALLASVIANQGTLTFSEMRFSTTDYDGVEQTLTVGTFGGVFITAAASGSVVDATTIKVGSQFDNSGIVGDHPLYSIGIVGTDGNTTALIAVCTTTNPDIIRAALTGVSTYAFNVNLAVSSTSNITVAGTTAAVLYDTDVVDNLTSIATNKPLSANQGRVLKGNIDDNFSGQSNENLFDNPWFTINQRGASGIISGANVYGYDRWCQAGAGGGYSVTSDGPIIHITMWQRVEDNSLLQGKKATFTMLYADGEITSGTGTIGSTITTSDGSTLDFPTNQYNISAGNTNKAVRAVKLELGSVSTLANDVAPDYALELAKCRASTADPSDTYANKGNLVNYADLTTIHATGSTNTTGAQIDAGTFFYLNGQFCKALANIAVNATFTLNTNFKVDSVGGELEHTKFHKIYEFAQHTTATADAWEYTGVSITIPAKTFFGIQGIATYANGRPTGVALNNNSSVFEEYNCWAIEQSGNGVWRCSICGYTDVAQTLYLWAKRNVAGFENGHEINGWYVYE